MGTVQIKNMMEDLKLPGMLKSYDALRSRATKESWTADELLDNLLQSEHQWREGQSSSRRVKGSKLPELPRFEDFDFTVKRPFTKVQIKELYTLRWLEQGRPLLLIGPTGAGKSFIAKALGHQACLRKKSVLFIGVSDLLENQASARQTGSYLRFRMKMAKPDVLILDDFGLRKLHAQEAHDFLDLLKERTGTKSTIITTQVPLDNWPEVIEDPVTADTTIDRLKHTSVKIELSDPNIDSYRKQQGAVLDKPIN
jgi:DNA replication protein DnaC